MKRLLIFGLSIIACAGLAMEQPQEEANKKKQVVQGMLTAKQCSYEKAFELINNFEANKYNQDLCDLLRKMVRKEAYLGLLEYAFENKKILPTDEIASTLLVEATCGIDKDNLFDLLLRYVSPNVPGRGLKDIFYPDAYEHTPLVLGIWKKDIKKVQALLNAGAHANRCQPHENLPIVEALDRFYLAKFDSQSSEDIETFKKMIRLLKEKGANFYKPNGKDIRMEIDGQKFTFKTAQEMIKQFGYEDVDKSS